jgi:hypothetical protein
LPGAPAAVGVAGRAAEVPRGGERSQYYSFISVRRRPPMKIDVYGKPGCARCESTKTKLTHFLKKWNAEDKVVLDFVDMQTPDGLARGVVNNVFDVIPVTIVLDDSEQQLARWEGDVPPSGEVARLLGVRQ